MRSLPAWEPAIARLAIAAVLMVFFHVSLGCGSETSGDDDDSDSAGSAGDDDGAFADDDGGDAADDDAGDDSDDDGPPPVEDDFDPDKRPVVCDGAVWVLNPEADYLSRIDAADLSVSTIEVGRGPTVLRATEDCETVVTLNTIAKTVSVIRDGAVAASLGVRPGANTLWIAPGSRYALATHHFEAGSTDTVGYGEVTVLDLRDLVSKSLAVGFPAADVAFNVSGDTAVLITETAVAVLDLTDASANVLTTGLDPTAGETVKKIAVTPDGDHALVLAEGRTSLLALDLADLSFSDVDLGCYPTDLDVPRTGDRSLTVCREEGRVHLIDNDSLDATGYDVTEIVGSGEIAADGSRAVLFTNADQIERVHVFTTSDASLATFLTVKPILGVSLAPGDARAVVFHEGGDGAPLDDFDAAMDTLHAFSIFNIDTGLLTPVQTPEPAEIISFSEDGATALLPMPGAKSVILAHLDRGLADEIAFSTKPLDGGIVTDLGLAFVLQEHPLGRISFIDVNTLHVDTITGFLLNGDIE
ncbi:MAG: hypothetical protein KJ042_15405 [Deltaproteobacteria bacterium]|nr:hypothetical protein [Deltaproteobacteria bacterium]